MSRKSLFALITGLILACALPSSAQHFQQIQGATLSKISAGGASVWGLDQFDHVFRYTPTTQTFDQITGTSLYQISAGGGNTSQPDEVWGINRAGHIFRFNPSTQTFDQIASSGSAQVIAVGPGYSECNPYEVWTIHPSHYVLRYNFCTSQFNPKGYGLTYLAVGPNEVWGTGSSGAFRFNFDNSHFEAEGFMYQVTVGVDGVYGIDFTGQLYEFNNRTTGWDELYGIVVKNFVAGGNGMWITNSSNDVFRFRPTFQSFVQVPGALARISVGSGTGVWGINAAGQVFVFETP